MATAKKAAPKASAKSDTSDNSKTLAIVAHIGWIGWIIALVLDKEKASLTRFNLRQTLIIYLCAFLGIIPILGIIVGLFVFVMWVMSLISAINGEEKEVPVIGSYGQQWFKGL